MTVRLLFLKPARRPMAYSCPWFKNCHERDSYSFYRNIPEGNSSDSDVDLILLNLMEIVLLGRLLIIRIRVFYIKWRTNRFVEKIHLIGQVHLESFQKLSYFTSLFGRLEASLKNTRTVMDTSKVMVSFNWMHPIRLEGSSRGQKCLANVKTSS